MIVNPDIILKNESKTKDYSNNCNENVNITGTFNVLGIEIYKDVTFDTHIAKLCCKVEAELNAISRLSHYLDISEKAEIFNTFIYVFFNCSSLVWRNSKTRCLRMLLDDYKSDYDAILGKIGKCMRPSAWKLLQLKYLRLGNKNLGQVYLGKDLLFNAEMLKICQNMCFLWPVFSCIRTVLIRENTIQRNPVF